MTSKQRFSVNGLTLVDERAKWERVTAKYGLDIWRRIATVR